MLLLLAAAVEEKSAVVVAVGEDLVEGVVVCGARARVETTKIASSSAKDRLKENIMLSL
jgi:hypothetical protein